MNRTATQHAASAAEAVNGLNRRVHAALVAAEDTDLTRLKDAYEVIASLKSLAQRLTLTATQMQQLVSQWHEEGHLVTGHAIDTDEVVGDFSSAMAETAKVARGLFTTLDSATESLGPIGWQDPGPSEARREAQS